MSLHTILRHYGWLFRYRLGFIIVFTSTIAVITFVISQHLAPLYQASALIKIDGLPASTSNDIFSEQALAVGDALLVTSPDVLQEASRRLTGTTLNQLKSAVSASPLDNTQIIEIRAQADNPQMAADIANTTASVFIQFQGTRELAKLQDSSDKFYQNLSALKMDIDTARKALTTLQSAHASNDTIVHQQSLLDVYQASYNTLLTSYNQLQVQKLQVSNGLDVAQTAVPPDRPSSPQVALNTVLFTCLALVVAIISIGLCDWKDESIKTSDDVANMTSLEPLGRIPLSLTPPISSQAPDIPVISEAVGEAFVSIGMRVRKMKAQYRSILITSTRSRAGTSTIATCLAISLASSGIRVLLVDANLRHPSLHEILHCPNAKGLLHNLVDVRHLKEQLPTVLHVLLRQWKTSIPNLWLLPAGPPVAYPSAILRMPELGLLVNRLLEVPSPASESAIDMIIFDTPALEQRADAIALTPVADAVVLVVEAGKDQKEALINVQNTFKSLDSPILGVVVNRWRPFHRSYIYSNLYTHTDYFNPPPKDDPPAQQPGRAQEPSLPFSAQETEVHPSFPFNSPTTPATPLPIASTKIGMPTSQFKPLSHVNISQVLTNEKERRR